MKRTVVITTILCTGLLLIGGNVNSNVVAQTQIIKQNNAVQEVISLTKEDALNILLKHNNELNYVYQGDENVFEVLKEKELSGYVFLPNNVDTDLGYFVNNDTQDIYYFHPSGYLDIIN